ncbi:hypothetical protein, partial [Polyangium spumosum]
MLPPVEPRRRHRTPIEEVNDVLRQLRIPELADVLLYAKRTLAARDAGPDPAVVSEILAAMSRLHPAYKNTQGVPLPILRGALARVPRAAFEAALLHAEREGTLKLIPVSLLVPFIERQAGILSPRELPCGAVRALARSACSTPCVSRDGRHRVGLFSVAETAS